MKGHAELPLSYANCMEVDLQKDKKLALLVNGLALAIAVVLVVIGALLAPFSLELLLSGGLASILRPLIALSGIFIYIILHELAHGVCMKFFSKLPVRYGFTGLYAYAGSDAYFDKSSYLITALAPVVLWGAVLGAACALVPAAWFWLVYIIQIINLSGAAGDLYVTYRFLKLPADILVRDTGVAMTVYAPAP